MTVRAVNPPRKLLSSSRNTDNTLEVPKTNKIVQKGAHLQNIQCRLCNHSLLSVCLYSSLISHNFINADHKQGFQTDNWQPLRWRHHPKTLTCRHLLTRPIVQRPQLLHSEPDLKWFRNFNPAMIVKVCWTPFHEDQINLAWPTRGKTVLLFLWSRENDFHLDGTSETERAQKVTVKSRNTPDADRRFTKIHLKLTSRSL